MTTQAWIPARRKRGGEMGGESGELYINLAGMLCLRVHSLLG